MRLEGIDLLRGLAVVSVVVYHYFVLMGHGGSPVFLGVHTLGLFGVSLFFVISGYLIYRSVARRVERYGLKTGLWRYGVHRFFRIVPAYYVNLVVVIALWAVFLGSAALLVDERFLKMMLAHLTFTSFFVYKDAGFGINGAYWTLNVEMLWYLLAPPMFLLLKRSWMFGALAAVGLLYFYALDAGWLDVWFGIDRHRPESWAQLFYLAFQLPGQILFFTAGILIYRRFPHFRSGHPRLLFVAAMGLFALYLWVAHRFAMIHTHFFWHNLLMAAVTAMMFLWMHRLHLPLLKPWSWVGEISYSIYLWHMPLLFLLKRTGWSGWWVPVAFAAALLAVSAVSYYGVERAGFVWQKRFEKKELL